MKENGVMIWLMVKVYIYTVEVQGMKENGKMIYKMVKELKHGLVINY